MILKRLSVILGLLLATSAWGQQSLEDAEITVLKVVDGLYMLEGPGGNIGVSIGEGGVVMIDDKFAPLAPKIKKALAGITDQPLRFVLNTHWHHDHTGGNEVFGESAPLIAHHNVRKRLADGINTPGRTADPASLGALPVITFDHDLTIHLNDQEIRAIHLPHAHTDGDVAIFFTKSNVAHLGDTFFSGRFPYVDLDSGGSSEGLVAGLERVLAEVPDDVQLIPGHGPLSKKSDLQSYVAMIKATRSIVRGALEKGKSPDEIVSEGLLGDYDDWSWSFIPTERWVATLASELK